MLDLVLFVALGAIQIGFAVWGGMVSVKSLPSGENRHLHALIFWVLGAFGLILTVVIGSLNYGEQQDAQRDRQEANKVQKQMGQDLSKAQTDLSASRLSEEYMRGQLQSISLMIGKQAEHSPDESLKEMAHGISKIVNQASGTPYRSVRVGDIKIEGEKLWKDMTDFQKAELAKKSQASSQLSNQMMGAATTSGDAMKAFDQIQEQVRTEIDGKFMGDFVPRAVRFLESVQTLGTQTTGIADVEMDRAMHHCTMQPWLASEMCPPTIKEIADRLR